MYISRDKTVQRGTAVLKVLLFVCSGHITERCKAQEANHPSSQWVFNIYFCCRSMYIKLGIVYNELIEKTGGYKSSDPTPPPSYLLV